MTYFLEKYYTIDYDGSIAPALYGYCLIRPCQWDYKKVLKFLNGEMPQTTYLRLEGQVAAFSMEKNSLYSQTGIETIEEWLIWLELNKGISPDFEEVHVNSIFKIEDDYVVKTVDLHTKEVLYDSMDKTLKKIRKSLKKS